MKIIILFKDGVETQEFFSYELAKTFEELGYKVFWYSLLDNEESFDALKRLVETNNKREITVFTFNHNGLAGEEYLYDGENNNFWDASEIPVINMVVDHPLYYHKYMPFVPERYCQISIDRNHEKYLQRFFPEINTGGFIPLGGTELNKNGALFQEENYLPMERRSIDVIFTGNYTPTDTFQRFISHLDQEYQDFYVSLVDEAILRPECLIEEIAEHMLKAEIGQVGDEDLRACMTNMMFVDLSVRFHFRAEAVRILADNGIPVHVYGAGWDMLECKHPENIIKAGGVDSLKCLEMISQSKISLNVMPWFKDGAHDRIFNSMLNGALCVTDGSVYLNEQFEDGKDILFYSLNDLYRLPELFTGMLGDTERLESIARNGYQKAKTEHTWESRARQINIQIEKLSGERNH